MYRALLLFTQLMLNSHFLINNFQNFEPTPITNPIEIFCVEKSKKFVHLIIKGSMVKFPMLFFDNHEFPNLHDVEMEMFKKQAGIILEHKESGNVELDVVAKRSHYGFYEYLKLKPEYPPVYLPPIIDLLSPEEFGVHDGIRWFLLKWMIDVDEDEIRRIPLDYVHDILTLNFLRRRGFIEVFEADLIFISIVIGRDQNHDKTLDKIPEVLEKRTFLMSFLFTTIRTVITRTLSVCGLERFKVRNFMDF